MALKYGSDKDVPPRSVFLCLSDGTSHGQWLTDRELVRAGLWVFSVVGKNGGQRDILLPTHLHYAHSRLPKTANSRT